MITLVKSPFTEQLAPDAPLYPIVCAQLQAWRKSQPSYMPFLIGIIRKEASSEVIFGALAHRRVNQNTIYCIDFYQCQDSSQDAHVFTHVTSLGKYEVNPFKEAHIACFDPLQEAARVRFVLAAFKQKKPELANTWMLQCLKEPVTKENSTDCIALVQYLASSSSGPHQNLPLAKLFIENIRKGNPNHPSALTCLGEIYQKGGEGVEQDLLKAERYLRRAVHCNKDEINARVALAVLYCEGGPNMEPNMHEGKRFFEEVLAQDPTNAVALNMLGYLSYKGGQGLRDLPKARTYYNRLLQQQPKNSLVKAYLEDISHQIGLKTLEVCKQITEYGETGDLLVQLSIPHASAATRKRLLDAIINFALNEDVCDLLISLNH